MIASQGKAASVVHFTQGFAVVVGGPIDDRVFARLGKELRESGLSCTYESPVPGIQVLSAGESDSTFATQELFAGGYSVIRGRPFLLDVADKLGERSWSQDSVGRVLSSIDGRFSLFFVDNDGRFVVSTDLLGSGSIYYFENSSRLVVATHLGFLQALVENVELEQDRAVGCFLTRGPCFGRTPYRGLEKLEGGKCITGRVSESAHLDHKIWSYTSVETALVSTGKTVVPETLDEAVEEFDMLLREAVLRENLPENFVLSLSGGKDSQCLAIAIKKVTGKPPRGITSRPEGHEGRWGIETRKALEFGKRFGLSISVVDWDLRAEWINAIAKLGGGAVSFETAKWCSVSFGDSERRLVICGYMGGSQAGSMIQALPLEYPRLQSQDAPLLVLPGISASRDIPLAKILLWAPSAVESIFSTIRSRWRKLSHIEPALRLDILNYTTRQAGWVSGVTQEVPELLAPRSSPFLYRPLMRFLLNLHPKFRLGQAMYVHWLKLNGWRPSSRRLARLSQIIAVANRARHLRLKHPPGEDSFFTPAAMNTRHHADLLCRRISQSFDESELLGQMSLFSLDQHIRHRPGGMPAVLSLLPMGMARTFHHKIS